jgi:predicted glycosyltransferase
MMTPGILAVDQRYAIRERDRNVSVPTIVLYSHDGFGLGHLSRTTFLARCIRDREPEADVLIVTSSPAAHRVADLQQFEYVKLPAVTKTGVERYRPHSLRMDLDSVVALRSALLLAIVQEVHPNLLLVDHRPLGLKKEVLPALCWIRERSPETRTVVGLRDVVDEPQTVIQDWNANGIYDVLEHLYDDVLVYGEQSVCDSTLEYAMPEPVARKVSFTGYLGRRAASRSRDEVRGSLELRSERLIVVHAGGGGDGFSLLANYLRCTEQLPSDVYSLVVTGPLMHHGEKARLWDAAASLPVKLVEYQEDLASCIAAADLSVSMGGYNTMCEVLSAGVRALVVPRVFPRREQYIRAQHLAACGLITVVLPTSLSPEKLAAAVRSSLHSRHRWFDSHSLDGGRKASEIISSRLHASADPVRHTVHG